MHSKAALPHSSPLQAVIHRQQESRWYRSFLSASRRNIVNIYLEDDHQLDQVYCYLNELYMTAVASAPCQTKLKSMEQVPFVLDVLLPEVELPLVLGCIFSQLLVCVLVRPSQTCCKIIVLLCRPSFLP